jgi:hypothetical protein
VAVGLFPGQSVEQVSGRLASWCASNGIPVLSAQPGAVSCGMRMMDIPGAEMRAAVTQVLIGNNYSTPVVLKLVFRVWPVANGAQVQATQVRETTFPGGMTNQVPVRSVDETRRMNNVLQELAQ